MGGAVARFLESRLHDGDLIGLLITGLFLDQELAQAVLGEFK